MATFSADFKVPELTEAQINEIKDKFNKADTDHNGKLDKNEITEVLKAQNLPTDNVDMIMKIGDANHDGGISFEEFLNILKLMAQLRAAQVELCKKLFDQIDKDKSGFLDEKEISEFLNLITGGKATPQQVKETMDKYDHDHDGKITFEELLNAGGFK